MKITFSTLLIFLSFVAFGQKIEFIDYNGKPCKEKNASRKKIYSVITRNDSTFYRVQDCSMWDEQKSDNIYIDEACTVLHGEQREYSKAGKLESLTIYREGMKHGKEIIFFPTGIRESVAEYDRGMQVNAFKMYYESGALKDSVFYANGDRTGSLYDYFENGKISFITPYKDGKIHGREIGFTSEGDTNVISNYVAGNREGLTTLILNGKPFDVEYYKEGKLDGPAKYYYENGNLSEETVYENGTAISCINYLENGGIRNRECEEQHLTEYPGGMAALKKFIGENLRYPEPAVEENIEGKIYLSLKVNKSGKLESVKIIRGMADCPECGKEAVRVVSLMHDWNVYPQHNRLMDTYYSLPIVFKLQ